MCVVASSFHTTVVGIEYEECDVMVAVADEVVQHCKASLVMFYYCFHYYN